MSRKNIVREVVDQIHRPRPATERTKAVEITVVFTADIPADTDIKGLHLWCGPTMVCAADGTHLEMPKAYETVNVEVIETDARSEGRGSDLI
jgi:hypothetical protein